MSNSTGTGSVEKLDDADPRIVSVFPYASNEYSNTLTCTIRNLLRYTAGATPWDASRDWGSSGAYQNTLHVTQDTGGYATVIFKGM